MVLLDSILYDPRCQNPGVFLLYHQCCKMLSRMVYVVAKAMQQELTISRDTYLKCKSH